MIPSKGKIALLVHFTYYLFGCQNFQPVNTTLIKIIRTLFFQNKTGKCVLGAAFKWSGK